MVSDTIFSPSFGNRPSYFIGRQTTLKAFEASLASKPGSKERATVLLGQRGSGKTVLLWEIAERATKAGKVVASPTVVSEGMLERIVEKIQDSGERYVSGEKVRITGGSLSAFGFSAGLQFSKTVLESKSFEYKLTQLARRLSEQGHGILILVDELQANSPEVKQLVIAYQVLVGEGLDVTMVLAGLPGAVSATLNDKVLTFLNRAQKISLDPLSIPDVNAYFEQSFRQLGISISADVCLAAARATQGSPYLLQLVGHSIAMGASTDMPFEAKELERALAIASNEYENDVCETTLAALSDQDVAFLEAMARDDGPSKMQDVAQRMGVTSDYAQKYRRRLIDSGVIASPSRGKVAMCVPYLRDHLRRRL